MFCVTRALDPSLPLSVCADGAVAHCTIVIVIVWFVLHRCDGSESLPVVERTINGIEGISIVSKLTRSRKNGSTHADCELQLEVSG